MYNTEHEPQSEDFDWTSFPPHEIKSKHFDFCIRRLDYYVTFLCHEWGLNPQLSALQADAITIQVKV
jgi:hypothetical protein